MFYLTENGAYDEAEYFRDQESKCEAHVGAYHMHQKELRVAEERAKLEEVWRNGHPYW